MMLAGICVAEWRESGGTDWGAWDFDWCLLVLWMMPGSEVEEELLVVEWWDVRRSEVLQRFLASEIKAASAL